MFATLANGSLRDRQQAFSSCHRQRNRGTVPRKTVQPAPGSCGLSIPGACAASKLQKQLQGTGQDPEGSSECSLHHTASILAAAALAASVLACPGAVMADDMLTTAQDAQVCCPCLSINLSLHEESSSSRFSRLQLQYLLLRAASARRCIRPASMQTLEHYPLFSTACRPSPSCYRLVALQPTSQQQRPQGWWQTVALLCWRE